MSDSPEGNASDSGQAPPPPPGGGQPPVSPGGGQPPAPPSGTPPAPPTGGAGGSGFDVVEAFRYGWEKFQQHMQPILIGMVALIVAGAVIGVLWFFVAGAIAAAFGGSDAGLVLSAVVSGVFLLGWVVVAFLVQAAIIRAGLAIVDGRPIETSTLLSTDHLPSVIVGALIVGVATAVGTMLCYIPGLIIAFLTQFFMIFILDRGSAPMDGIRASYELARDNLGDVVLLYIGVAVVTSIGAALCLVGLVVAFPVAVIAQTYAYRKLQGQPVA